MTTLKLNGSDISLSYVPRTTLLDILHQHGYLFGTKKGARLPDSHGQTY